MLQQLDLNVSAMADNFANLVKAARINDEEDKRSKDKKIPGEMPEVLAEKIVLGAKGLLELVAELKKKVRYSCFVTYMGVLLVYAQAHPEYATCRQL